MAKQTGLGDNFYVAGRNFSNATNSLQRISSPRGSLEMTGVDKFAVERKLTFRDGAIDWTSYFDPETVAGGGTYDGAHSYYSTLPRTDVHVMYARGTTIGNPSAALIAKQIDYAPNRTNDGGILFSIASQANGYGLEWGRLMTAGVRSDTGATNGTAVDFTAGTSFGLQAYLQVFSFTGTDVTIKIQESSDNDADTYADVTGGGFTEVTTGPTVERIQTARDLAVERYLRVATVTTGGFSELSFAVMVVKNTAEVLFSAA